MDEQLTTCTLTLEPQADDLLATADDLPLAWEQVSACLVVETE